jgi:hypothetical protein
MTGASEREEGKKEGNEKGKGEGGIKSDEGGVMSRWRGRRYKEKSTRRLRKGNGGKNAKRSASEAHQHRI